MNCNQIKSIRIIDFLNQIGIQPTKENKNEIWINLRGEKTASLKVDIIRNIWFDFESGEGGNIITLAKRIYQTDLKGVLLKFSSFPFSPAIKPNPVNNIAYENKKILIKHIQQISNKALIDYLNNRKIPLTLAKQYLNEAYFNNNQFALCFKNDKGGYELSNKYFKGSTSPKWITTILKPGSKKLIVFEGFFDFLSALQYFQTNEPKHNTIILNSLSMLKNICPLLKGFDHIYLFLDNDKSGIESKEQIKKIHYQVTDYSNIIYPEYKDFNDFITGKKLNYGK